MRRILLASALAAFAVIEAAAPDDLYAQDPKSEELPLETGAIEEEQVRLVILDVVVVDRHGNTVSDLTADDFEIRAGGKMRAVDTVDVQCDAGALAEPATVNRPSQREVPDYSGSSRKIVLALDYLHIPPILRTEVIGRARDTVRHTVASGDEIMVVALNGGLRIEQHFTDDRDDVLATLDRMEFDITLWQPDYFHLRENLFVDPLVALLDLLGQEPGNKAMVLYSTMRDVPLDFQFNEIAAIAATSRCAIYPVDAAGLRTPLGGPDGAGPTAGVVAAAPG
jgi:VWFA-related protein